MLAALNTRETYSKQTKQRYDDVPNYKISALVMIRNFEKNTIMDAKYKPNFRVVHLTGSRQLEVLDPTGRTRKVNFCAAHKIVPSNNIISSVLDEYGFGRRGKYINDA